MTHPLPENITQEEANQFILICHIEDLDPVKKWIFEKPEIVNVYNSDLHETALGAAGHMGRSVIAEYLLKNGAELELATAAMLGMKDTVTEWLEKDSSLAHSGGAHNIPVAFHAAMSGDTEIMQMLWESGAEEHVQGALHGAVKMGHTEMARWLLDHQARLDIRDFQGKTALEAAEEYGYDEIATLINNYSEGSNQ